MKRRGLDPKGHLSASRPLLRVEKMDRWISRWVSSSSAGRARRGYQGKFRMNSVGVGRVPENPRVRVFRSRPVAFAVSLFRFSVCRHIQYHTEDIPHILDSMCLPTIQHTVAPPLHRRCTVWTIVRCRIRNYRGRRLQPILPPPTAGRTVPARNTAGWLAGGTKYRPWRPRRCFLEGPCVIYPPFRAGGAGSRSQAHAQVPCQGGLASPR